MPSRRTALLYCGLAAPLVYLGADVAASIAYDGYSWSKQAVSELFAVEAQTRNLILVCFTVFNALLFAYAFGIWGSADGRRALRAIALLAGASALLGVVTDFFAPMHARGFEQGASGQWHIILTGVQTLLIFAMLGCGTRTLGRGFRIASAGLIVWELVVGVITSVLTTDPETEAPAAWFGVAERLLIYAWLAWLAALALQLLREDQPE